MLVFLLFVMTVGVDIIMDNCAIGLYEHSTQMYVLLFNKLYYNSS